MSDWRTVLAEDMPVRAVRHISQQELLEAAKRFDPDAYKEPLEEAGSTDKGPHFDHPDREGADALEQAGYVEQAEFEQPMGGLLKDGKSPAGYFCATCEYYLHDEAQLKGGWCTKLSGADAAHGCCDLWEFNKSGKIKEAEAGSSEDAGSTE